MIYYAILLLILAVALALMEILLPSGGVLGILSAAAFAGALVLAFKVSAAVGFVFLAAAAVLVPTVIILGLKIFPKTPIGKKVILIPTVETSQERGTPGVADEDYSPLMGKTGKAITPLRPSGIAQIENERYSVVAEGELIDQGVDIVVINVQGNSIVVDQQNS